MKKIAPAFDVVQLETCIQPLFLITFKKKLFQIKSEIFQVHEILR